MYGPTAPEWPISVLAREDILMYGPSDMYGDLSIEDVDEFEGLQPDDEHEIDLEGKFQRDEVRSFEEDFEWELDHDEEYYPEPEWSPDDFELDNESSELC